MTPEREALIRGLAIEKHEAQLAYDATRQTNTAGLEPDEARKLAADYAVAEARYRDACRALDNEIHFPTEAAFAPKVAP